MFTTQQLLLAILSNVTQALQQCNTLEHLAEYAGEDACEHVQTHNAVFAHVSAIAEDMQQLAQMYSVQL